MNQEFFFQFSSSCAFASYNDANTVVMRLSRQRSRIVGSWAAAAGYTAATTTAAAVTVAVVGFNFAAISRRGFQTYVCNTDSGVTRVGVIRGGNWRRSWKKNWRPFFSHRRLESDDLFSCGLLTTPIFPLHLSSVVSKFSHNQILYGCHPWMVSPAYPRRHWIQLTEDV